MNLKNARPPFLDFLSQFIQLTIISWIVVMLKIEDDLGLTILLPLCTAVFLVYTFLPVKAKPILLFGASIGLLYFLIGPWSASVFMVLSLIMIGIAHLKISFIVRCVLIGIIGLLLFLARFGILPFPMSFSGLRILAAVFMFRMIFYLYEIRHEKEKVSIWQRLTYFFILPNFIFPLFPIVDFKSWKKTLLSSNVTATTQKGINLIIWSIFCLLFYRVLYYYGVPDVELLKGTGDVLWYNVATYLTVIRLVGILSMSVGLIRVFGYDLPPIFNYMFLAHSFSDFFRRINIYWKNFLIKVIYYPTYFRVRKINKSKAILISMFIAFLWTWFFHVYQWAWILGENPIRETGVFYWGTFAILATISSQIESKKKELHLPKNAVIHGFKILGMFASMSILYTIWTHPTLKSWYEIMLVSKLDLDSVWWIYIGSLLLAGLGIGALVFLYYRFDLQKMKIENPLYSGALGIVLLLCLVIGLDFNKGKYPALEKFIEDSTLNENEDDKVYNGYYDGILKADVSSKLWDDGSAFDLEERKDRFFSKFKKTYKKVAEGWNKNNGANINDWKDKDYFKKTGNILRRQLLPNYNKAQYGKPFITNEWGMRDKSYSKEKPDSVIRIAIMAGSPMMGIGVGNDEIFDVYLEEKFNNDPKNIRKIEVLNFACEGRRTYQMPFELKSKIIDFNPDYLLTFEHFQKMQYSTHYINLQIEEDDVITEDLEAYIKSEGFDIRKPMPLHDKITLGRKITKWSYREMMAICRENDIKFMTCLLPGKSRLKNADPTEINRIMKEYNIETIDFSKIYLNYSDKELYVSKKIPYTKPWVNEMVGDSLNVYFSKHLSPNETQDR